MKGVRAEVGCGVGPPPGWFWAISFLPVVRRGGGSRINLGTHANSTHPLRPHRDASTHSHTAREQGTPKGFS